MLRIREPVSAHWVLVSEPSKLPNGLSGIPGKTLCIRRRYAARHRAGRHADASQRNVKAVPAGGCGCSALADAFQKSARRLSHRRIFRCGCRQKLRAVKLADAAAVHSGGGTRRLCRCCDASPASVMLGYIGISLRQVDYPQDIIPFRLWWQRNGCPTHSRLSSPAPEMVASVPAGLPIWTGALFAEQTPVHFASIDLSSPGNH